jgi:hypothetical protein
MTPLLEAVLARVSTVTRQRNSSVIDEVRSSTRAHTTLSVELRQ